MFEHRAEPLLNHVGFVWRLTRAFLLTLGIVAISVIGGTLGYRFFLDLPWADAFHHACLVLGEHSPESQPQTAWGKAFVGLFVMYSRLVFFSIVTILALPLLHRILHKLHLDEAVAEER